MVATVVKVIKVLLRFLPPFNLGPLRVFSVSGITTLHQASVKPINNIHSVYKITRLPAISCSNEPHYKFNKGAPGLLEHSPGTYCGILDNAYVYGWNGCVIDQRNRLVTDISPELGVSESGHSLLNYLIVRKPYSLKGVSATIAASNNYFHWMTDVLPRLEILAKAGYPHQQLDHLIVNNLDEPFQQQSLAALNIRSGTAVSLAVHLLIKCKRLVVPSLSCESGNVPKWIVDFLRQSFSTLMKPSANTPSKVFISRADAWKRRMLNEKEVGDYLEKDGFKTVQLEQLTFEEQVSLFYNAREIVGPHGAGFTNLVFAQSGAKVIELFPPTYVNQCFWTIASHCNLDYAYLVGEGKDTTTKDHHLNDTDFEISVKKLKAFRDKTA